MLLDLGIHMGNSQGNAFVFRGQSLLDRRNDQSRRSNESQCKNGLIVTGDSFINDGRKVQEILRHFPDALACEMEGAAIAQTAKQFNIPFLVVRAIE